MKTTQHRSPPYLAATRRHMPIEIVTHDPLNGETPRSALGRDVTPVEDFYVRNNFAAPSIDPDAWRLRIGGLVSRELELSLEELQRGQVFTRVWTLECAGNGRQGFDPPVPGTPWGVGAAGTARFTGVRLADVLDQAELLDHASTLVFTGADAGVVDGVEAAFRRSLGRDVARGDAMLAWAMNGEPLTRDHGAPVRLVVPRYYAVASVKWLVRIDATDRSFEGPFQTERYRYLVPGREPVPVTTMRVRSLVTSHHTGDVVAAGPLELSGVAWSGAGALARVEVALDDGDWREARTGARAQTQGEAGVASTWVADLDVTPGPHRVRVRASDAAGNVQPAEAPWNQLGYGNNAVQTIELIARER